MPKIITFTMFLNKSNSVFGLARFLKYFVGLNFSALNSIGFVVNKGPICIISPKIPTKEARTKIGNKIRAVGKTVFVNI